MSTSAAIAINGRFLAQASSGVQRFALELVRALDAHLAAGERSSSPVIELLVPDDAREAPPLEVIRVRRVAGKGGHLWDQRLRWHCDAGTMLVNLANGGCVLRGNSLTVLHDAAVYRTPKNFTWAYRRLHQTLGRLLALSARIATVSAFSRDELCAVLKLDPRQVPVIPNAWEHLAHVRPDEGVVTRLGLTAGRYFLAIGSPAPNKNLPRAIEGFLQLGLPDERLVIVGKLDNAVFGRSVADAPSNVLMPGRLTDAEVAGLLAGARALVFPSLYEGFGIPPLEAMLYRCPVLASDIPVVREVCADAALFFDPLQPPAIAAAMRRAIAEPDLLERLREHGSARLKRYSWHQSAVLLLEALRPRTSSPVLASHPEQNSAP